MHAGGAPTKYKPEMCDAVTRLMSVGASKYEVAAEIDVSFETISQWCDPSGLYFKPEFSESVKSGLRLSQAWWERNGRENLQNKDFSYTGWYMNMKNRFKWADRQEIDHNVKTTPQILDDLGGQTECPKSE